MKYPFENRDYSDVPSATMNISLKQRFDGEPGRGPVGRELLLSFLHEAPGGLLQRRRLIFGLAGLLTSLRELLLQPRHLHCDFSINA